MTGEHDWEPVRGLPGRLPAGEHMLWQGSPDAVALARAVFHVRAVGAYFALLAAVALVSGSPGAAIATLVSGIACLALLALFAWGIARTTIYTLTNRRIVLRVGMALPKAINLPLSQIEAADLRDLGSGRGDIALTMTPGGKRLGYLFLWPHARPWKLAAPQPMLRGLPHAQEVAETLARACSAVTQIARTAPSAPSADAAGPALGAAA
jgi:hypothetical protein